MKKASKLAEIARHIGWERDTFPVCPITIAKKLGLRVLETDLPNDIASALFQEPGKDPTIVLHSAHSNSRQRFNCAYQLGNYIFETESKALKNRYKYLQLKDSA